SLILPTATMRTNTGSVGGGDARGVEPQRLEIVVAARVLVEDVDHDLTEVDERPVAPREPLDAHRPHAVLLAEVILDAAHDGVHLAIAAAAHHDDVIGVVDLAAHVD